MFGRLCWQSVIRYVKLLIQNEQGSYYFKDTDGLTKSKKKKTKTITFEHLCSYFYYLYDNASRNLHVIVSCILTLSRDNNVTTKVHEIII